MKNLILVVCLCFLGSPALALTKRESETIVSEFIQFATPMVREAIPDFRRRLKINIDWKSPTAIATPGYITGKLLLLPYMSSDAVVLILCHEMGHSEKLTKHFVGPVKFSGQEIKADYFATRVCVPRLLEESPVLSAFPHQIQLPESVKKTCLSRHPDDISPTLCVRALQASLVTIHMLHQEHFLEAYKSLGFAPPNFLRKWLGISDNLQCRLINMANGVFGRTPIECNDI
jgi:hypothetical protein